MAEDRQPDDQVREKDEDDTEGHSLLPDMGMSRQLAQARERDIQRHLKQHDRETDARANKKNHR
jgi:hypothetical protein